MNHSVGFVRKKRYPLSYRLMMIVLITLFFASLNVSNATTPVSWKLLSNQTSSVQKYELALVLQPLAKTIPFQTKSYTCKDCKAVPSAHSAIDELIRKHVFSLDRQMVYPKQVLTYEQAAVPMAKLIAQMTRKSWPSATVQASWKSSDWASASIQLLRKHKIGTTVNDYRKPLDRVTLKNWLQLVLSYQQLPLKTTVPVKATITPIPTALGDDLAVPVDASPDFELYSVNPSEVVVISKRFLATLGPEPTGSPDITASITPSPSPAPTSSLAPGTTPVQTITPVPTSTPKVYPVTLANDLNSDLAYSWTKDLVNPAKIRFVPKSTFAPGKYELRWSQGSPSPQPIVFQIEKPYLKMISMERAEVVRGTESLIPLTFQDQYGQAVEVQSGDIGIALIHAVTGNAYKEKITYDTTEKRFRIDLSKAKVNDRFQMNVIHRSGLMAHGVISVVNPKNVLSIRLKPEKTIASGTVLESTIAVNSLATDQSTINYTKALLTGDLTIALQNPLDNQQLLLTLEGASKITGLVWSNGRMRIQYVVTSKADTIRLNASVGTVQSVQSVYTIPATPQPSPTATPAASAVPSGA